MPVYPGYECCEGLTTASIIEVLNETCSVPIVGSVICIDCRNAVCETESSENKCNCPDDCL